MLLSLPLWRERGQPKMAPLAPTPRDPEAPTRPMRPGPLRNDSSAAPTWPAWCREGTLHQARIITARAWSALTLGSPD